MQCVYTPHILLVNLSVDISFILTRTDRQTDRQTHTTRNIVMVVITIINIIVTRLLLLQQLVVDVAVVTSLRHVDLS